MIAHLFSRIGQRHLGLMRIGNLSLPCAIGRYTRPIKLPSSLSHEKLWREDSLYDIVIETDWNRRPAIRGRGSAIFIHLARPGFKPTEGCIAFDRKGMKLFLSLLRMNMRIHIH